MPCVIKGHMSHNLSAAGHAHPVLRTCLWGFLMLTQLLTVHGATIQWTNTGGGLWNVPANWSPNVLPGALDMVVITNDGTYTVTGNSNATVAQLRVGGGTGMVDGVAAGTGAPAIGWAPPCWRWNWA